MEGADQWRGGEREREKERERERDFNSATECIARPTEIQIKAEALKQFTFVLLSI